MAYDKEYFRERERIAREEKKEEKKRTYDERKAKALTGTYLTYVACPLCGMTKRRAKFLELKKINDDFLIIQERCTGGRGTGFFTVGGTPLKDLKSEDNALFDELKEKVEKLNELLQTYDNQEGITQLADLFTED